MYYARQYMFGTDQLLLQSIVNDNRQVTTRSLMIVFSALMSLSLKDDESFDQFERRIDLLVQRLHKWRPPVVLPEQLILFCVFFRRFSMVRFDTSSWSPRTLDTKME